MTVNKATRKTTTKQNQDRYKTSPTMSYSFFDQIGCDSEDDDDIVVYGSQQASQRQSQSQHPSSLLMSQQSPQSLRPVQEMDLSKTVSMPREERRKRRREWKNLHQYKFGGHSPGSSSSDDLSLDNEQEDEGFTKVENSFASLQALLQKDTSQSETSQDETNCASTEVVLHDEKKPLKQPVRQATASISEASSAPVNEMIIPIPKASPPDFAMIPCDDDYGSRCSSRRYRGAKQRCRKKDHEPTTGNVHETKKRKRSRGIPEKSPQSESPSHSRKYTSSSRTLESKCSNNKEQRVESRRHTSKQTFSTPMREATSTPPSAKMSTTEKNIIGVRPTHWTRQSAPRKCIPNQGFLRAAAAQAKAARRNQLRAATMRSSVSPPGKGQASLKHLSPTSRKENQPHNSLNGTPVRPMTTEKLKNMSYRPITMPKPRFPEDQTAGSSDNLTNPETGSHQTPTGGHMASIDRPTFTSPKISRRQRHSRKSNGVWSKRFAACMSSLSNDAMKLQHDGMNRYGGVFDINDPRKKAKHYTDVTIVSQEDYRGVSFPKSWGFGGATSDFSSITTLCFIHSHCLTKPSARSPSENKVEATYAWIKFSQGTARNVGLVHGLSLRLYDAVLIPLPGTRPDESEGEDCRLPPCRWTIICTELCEKNNVPQGEVSEHFIGGDSIAIQQHRVQKPVFSK